MQEGQHAEEGRREAALARRAAAAAERAQLMERLLNGVQLVKHGKRGAPKPRTIYLDPNGRFVVWVAPGAPVGGSKGKFSFRGGKHGGGGIDCAHPKDRIELRTLHVAPGKSTPILRKATNAQPSRCLALVCTDGASSGRETLDLEANSEALRDLLVNCFRHAIASAGGEPVASGGGGDGDGGGGGGGDFGDDDNAAPMLGAQRAQAGRGGDGGMRRGDGGAGSGDLGLGLGASSPPMSAPIGMDRL